MEDKKLSLAEFSPAEAQLQELANKAKSVDTNDIVAVHDARIDLRDARVALTKKGKELREGALQFQKSVIAKEKDLLAIITPEEERLDAIETEYKQKQEMEKRRAELPTRRAAIDSIGLPSSMFTDEQLLSMDDAKFNEFRLSLIEQKLAEDKRVADEKRREEDRIAREKLDAERAEFEAKKKADENRIRRENDAANEIKRAEEAKLAAEKAEIAKEKARLEGIEEEHQRKIKAEKEEAELKAAKEAADAKKAADEKARVEAEKAYQDWLSQIGFDKSQGDIIHSDGQTVTAYRPIGVYNIKK